LKYEREGRKKESNADNHPAKFFLSFNLKTPARRFIGTEKYFYPGK
jgi:hypothetical protein